MLIAFDGHAVPIDDETLGFLHGHGIVEEGTSLDEGQRFVEHAVKAEESYDFFAALRRVVLADAAKSKKAKR